MPRTATARWSSACPRSPTPGIRPTRRAKSRLPISVRRSSGSSGSRHAEWLEDPAMWEPAFIRTIGSRPCTRGRGCGPGRDVHRRVPPPERRTADGCGSGTRRSPSRRARGDAPIYQGVMFDITRAEARPRALPAAGRGAAGRHVPRQRAGPGRQPPAAVRGAQDRGADGRLRERMDGASGHVGEVDPSRRPGSRPAGESEDGANGRALRDRVPVPASRWVDRVGAGHRAVGRTRWSVAGMAGRDRGHHGQARGRGASARGRDTLPPPGRADPGGRLHRCRRRDRHRRSTSARSTRPSPATPPRSAWPSPGCGCRCFTPTTARP